MSNLVRENTYENFYEKFQEAKEQENYILMDDVLSDMQLFGWEDEARKFMEELNEAELMSLRSAASANSCGYDEVETVWLLLKT